MPERAVVPHRESAGPARPADQPLRADRRPLRGLGLGARADGTVADGRSIFSMMTLAAGQGAELVVEADGRQAAEVLEALAQLVAGGFGET
jgi:hypothetical protein